MRDPEIVALARRWATPRRLDGATANRVGDIIDELDIDHRLSCHYFIAACIAFGLQCGTLSDEELASLFVGVCS